MGFARAQPILRLSLAKRFFRLSDRRRKRLQTSTKPRPRNGGPSSRPPASVRNNALQVGWGELLRNPSWAEDGVRKSSTHPTTELGQEIFPPERQTPQALADFHKAEAEKWWPIIKAAGISPE